MKAAVSALVGFMVYVATGFAGEDWGPAAYWSDTIHGATISVSWTNSGERVGLASVVLHSSTLTNATFFVTANSGKITNTFVSAQDAVAGAVHYAGNGYLPIDKNAVLSFAGLKSATNGVPANYVVYTIQR